jgi:hypothetical protein
MTQKEFILCAAIWYNTGDKHELQPYNIETGFVVAGRRHCDCYATVKALVGMDEVKKLKMLNAERTMSLEDHRMHQGFLTSKNRYVDRKEAWKIAKENNQIKYGLEASDRGEDSILISENLY